MRPRLLSLLIACGVLLAMPAASPAALTVGLSENSPNMFGDPLFQPLGVKHVRVVTPYDVMVKDNGGYLGQLTAYLEAARANRIEPLVSFQHTRADTTICNKKANYGKAACKLPTTAQYTKAIRAFFDRFPYVKVVSPWNEVNHFTQPTSRNAKAAARFTDIAARACGKGCRIVAMDILDQADNAKAKRPVYTKTVKYIKTMKAAMKTKETICGLHNYSGVNRFTDAGTRTIIKAMGCKHVWLTETGGLYDFGSFWGKSTKKGCSTNASCQLKATKYMFTLAKRSPKIKRLYVYSFFGGVTPRFDSGIVENGEARPAYTYLKQKI